MFFRTFFIQPRVNHLLLGNPTTIWEDNPTTGWKRTPDHGETHLRRLKMKNMLFNKTSQLVRKQIEIAKEHQRFSTLWDTSFFFLENVIKRGSAYDHFLQSGLA